MLNDDISNEINHTTKSMLSILYKKLYLFQRILKMFQIMTWHRREGGSKVAWKHNNKGVGVTKIDPKVRTSFMEYALGVTSDQYIEHMHSFVKKFITKSMYKLKNAYSK